MPKRTKAKREGQVEIRQFSLLEVRADDGDSGEIYGHAAVFDQPTQIGSVKWGYQEVIRPGAFTKTLQEGRDVFALFNHDPNIVLAGTKNESLSLTQDTVGLAYRFTPIDTQASKDTRALIRSGLVDKASFAFQIIKERWTENNDNTPDLREILEVELWDISPVVYPAYEGTSVIGRNVAGIDVDQLAGAVQTRNAPVIREAIQSLEEYLGDTDTPSDDAEPAAGDGPVPEPAGAEPEGDGPAPDPDGDAAARARRTRGLKARCAVVVAKVKQGGK